MSSFYAAVITDELGLPVYAFVNHHKKLYSFIDFYKPGLEAVFTNKPTFQYRSLEEMSPIEIESVSAGAAKPIVSLYHGNVEKPNEPDSWVGINLVKKINNQHLAPIKDSPDFNELSYVPSVFNQSNAFVFINQKYEVDGAKCRSSFIQQRSKGGSLGFNPFYGDPFAPLQEPIHATLNPTGKKFVRTFNAVDYTSDDLSSILGWASYKYFGCTPVLETIFQAEPFEFEEPVQSIDPRMQEVSIRAGLKSKLVQLMLKADLKARRFQVSVYKIYTESLYEKAFPAFRRVEKSNVFSPAATPFAVERMAYHYATQDGLDFGQPHDQLLAAAFSDNGSTVNTQINDIFEQLTEPLNTAFEAEQVWSGFLSGVEIIDGIGQVKILPYTTLLNRDLQTKKLSRRCRHDFGSTECAVNLRKEGYGGDDRNLGVLEEEKNLKYLVGKVKSISQDRNYVEVEFPALYQVEFTPLESIELAKTGYFENLNFQFNELKAVNTKELLNSPTKVNGLTVLPWSGNHGANKAYDAEFGKPGAGNQESYKVDINGKYAIEHPAIKAANVYLLSGISIDENETGFGDAGIKDLISNFSYTAYKNIVLKEKIYGLSNEEIVLEGSFELSFVNYIFNDNSIRGREIRRIIRKGEINPTLLLPLNRKADKSVKQGNLVIIAPGCNRSYTMCEGYYKNGFHFGGFPLIPDKQLV